MGATVTIAENGKEAIDAAMQGLQNGEPFDVILMDMQMPIMDGYTATSLLRNKNYKHTIIALTAHAMAEDRQKCIDAGCDDYLSKPIDKAKMQQTISKYLQDNTDQSTRLAG